VAIVLWCTVIPLTSQELENLAKLQETILSEAMKKLDKSNELDSVHEHILRQFEQHPDTPASTLPFPEPTLESISHLKADNVSTRLWWFTWSGQADYYGSHLHTLSARGFGDEVTLEGRHNDIAGGYHQVVSYLHQRCMASGLVQIDLSCTVTAIQQDDLGVVLTTTNGAIACDRAIVTIPIGVLKASLGLLVDSWGAYTDNAADAKPSSATITFTPPLSQSKVEAIQMLGVGLLNKVVLIFAQPFWKEDVECFEFIGQYFDSSAFVHCPDATDCDGWYGQGHALVLYSRGAVAVQFEAMSIEEAAHLFMTTLRKAFGHVRHTL
jgi:hypothetical protein